MSIHHVVRCDECRDEVDMRYEPRRQDFNGLALGDGYLVPSGWKQIDGKQFCSWACVGMYGEEQAAKAKIAAFKAGTSP